MRFVQVTSLFGVSERIVLLLFCIIFIRAFLSISTTYKYWVISPETIVSATPRTS